MYLTTIYDNFIHGLCNKSTRGIAFYEFDSAVESIGDDEIMEFMNLHMNKFITRYRKSFFSFQKINALVESRNEFVSALQEKFN